MERKIPVLLLTGAFLPEIDILDKELSGITVKHPLKQSGEKFRIEVMQLGVGNLEAAINLQKRLLNVHEEPVSEVIFFGSAGVYPSVKGAPAWRGLSSESYIKKIGFGKDFYSLEWSVLDGKSYQPDLMQKHIEGNPGVFASNLYTSTECFPGDVNSPDSVTLDDSIPRKMQPQLSFENMESFGVAFTCRTSGVPFASIFSITNIVGPAGSNEWKTNYRDCSVALQIRASAILKKHTV